MRKIKVFSISQNDWGGCGYFLSDAINRTTEHHSISARMNDSVLDFPYDLTGLTRQRVKLLVSWCDIVHIHDAGYNLPELRGKPVVVTFHGTKFRRSPQSHLADCTARNWLPTVATPDLTSFGPPLLPDCRPDLSEYRCPNDEFTVIHAPTNRDVKGTSRVVRACKKLGVKLDIIENRPWLECMERKGRGRVVVDQFGLGYGCNAIEAWSMRMPVVSDGSDPVIETINNVFGYLPFVKPETTLEETLARLRDDVEFWIKWASIGHQHYLNHHSPHAAASSALRVYKQMLQSDKPDIRRTMLAMRGQALASKVVLVRYLGGNSGETKWFAPSGMRYFFDGKEPVRYIYEDDAGWFLGLRGKGEKALFARET